MLHVTFTKDFRVPGAPLGYLAVQTPRYFAAWHHFEPDTVVFHAADGDGLAHTTLRLAGALVLADNTRIELGKTAPVNLEELRQEETSRDWAGSGGERTELTLRFRGEAPASELVLHFYEGHIELKLHTRFGRESRIECVELATGTEFDAAEIVNPGSNSTGIHRYALNRPLYIRPDWFTPPPYCYAYMLRNGGAVAVGVEEGRGNMSFTRFLTAPDAAGRQSYHVHFDSTPKVCGAWTAPTLALRFGATDAYDAFKLHADGMVAAGKAPAVARDIPAWWRGVMFCGWLYQCFEGKKCSKGGMHMCTQAVYEPMIRRMQEEAIDYDILTLDAWWGERFGIWREDKNKWPDLKGFIASEHAAGKRVLLWLCPNTPGLPEEETYIDDLGNVMADPLNPAWRKRVAESMRYILGELDGDGIKFDFTEVMPRAGMKQGTRELHGLDYLYELFRVMHDAAKAVKPDALLDFQIANPVFADTHDMSRLNDFFMAPEQALRVMRHRGLVARAVTRGAMVDTDCPCSADYFTHSPEFGNLSLYIAECELENPEVKKAIQKSIRKIKHGS